LKYEDKYIIDVLDKAIDILETLAGSEGKPLGASDLAEAIAISRGRVYRILKTLEARSMVVQEDKWGGGYKLGTKFLELGESVRKGIDLINIAAPHLKELAMSTGGVTYLVVLRGNHAIAIDRYQGSRDLEPTVPIGMPLPIYQGASPKLLLAYLPELNRNKLIENLELRPFTEYTITDRAELHRRLAQIRVDGYSIDNQEYVRGVISMGAPIRDSAGSVVAGASLVTLSQNCDENRKKDLIDKTIKTADKISARLGYDISRHKDEILESSEVAHMV
jgi:IclR family KDG regulon transcriptional repressor